MALENSLPILFEFNDFISELAALVKAVPPPAVPIAPGSSEQWTLIEASLGTALPEDYKQLISLYGQGAFADFLWLNNPFFGTQPEIRYTQFFRQRLQGLLDGQQEWPQYAAPFSVWPVKDGLLPFGYTPNGDTLCWLTKGQPLEWTIVLLDSKTSESYDLYALSLSSFLWAWLNGEVCPSIFPDNIFSGSLPIFRGQA